MEIQTGKIKSAQKVVIYGPEGIGKSTFASLFPNPVFIDTEGSTKELDVKRFAKPESWSMLLQQIQYIKSNPSLYSTLIIDTVDWAEMLCINHLCDTYKKTGIEDFGWGKGYVYLKEEFGKCLNLLEDLIERNIHVALTAHAEIKKFEQPDEMGSYDRWKMKLSKNCEPLVKEWSDMLLFANYKTIVINVDNRGVLKGKNKAQGGKRVMYTTHSPSWDAKNRHNLPEELPFEYNSISHCIHSFSTPEVIQPQPSAQAKETVIEGKSNEPVPAPPVEVKQNSFLPEGYSEADYEYAQKQAGIWKALDQLISSSDITIKEIQTAVARRGYFPEDMPIYKYPIDFVSGVLVGAWEKVSKMVYDLRAANEEYPFLES